MSANDYCTTDDLEEWLGSTSGNTPVVFERAVTAASRSIDEYCQRHFWQTEAATPRDLPASDQRLLTLGAFNDLSVITALATDAAGDGTFETTWSASDYELLPTNQAAAPQQRPWTEIRSTGTRLFPLPSLSGRTTRVRVTGTWGWPAIPVDVTQACLLLAARYFKRKDSPDGVSGWGEFGVVRIGRNDPDIAGLLDPYRRYAVLVA